MQRHRGHCSSRRLFCFLLVNLLITLYVTASKVELSLTKDKPVQSFDALNGVTYTICSTQRTEFDLKSIFHQLVVVDECREMLSIRRVPRCRFGILRNPLCRERQQSIP